tara:strand:+ start:1111 stop:1326 length:216 start_codon:yes stop_codon:yes gene_type:complete
MKPLSEVEKEYNGITEDNLRDQQLQIAVSAFHVLAVMHSGNPEYMAKLAIDTLREMEDLGYYYEQYSDECD